MNIQPGIIHESIPEQVSAEDSRSSAGDSLLIQKAEIEINNDESANDKDKHLSPADIFISENS